MADVHYLISDASRKVDVESTRMTAFTEITENRKITGFLLWSHKKKESFRQMI